MFLNFGDPQTVDDAVVRLLPPERARVALLAVLPDVSAAATACLAKVGRPEDVPVLRAMLARTTPGVRKSAVERAIKRIEKRAPKT